jgi:hypothetical protein
VHWWRTMPPSLVTKVAEEMKPLAQGNGLR